MSGSRELIDPCKGEEPTNGTTGHVRSGRCANAHFRPPGDNRASRNALTLGDIPVIHGSCSDFEVDGATAPGPCQESGCRYRDGVLTVYTYQGCSTCRKATQWLRTGGLQFSERPIRETPPSLAELQAMLQAQGGTVRALFNTSGLDYRAMGFKDSLPGMSGDDALRLLAGNGNLIKRPFAIDPESGVHLIGFREEAWKAALG